MAYVFQRPAKDGKVRFTAMYKAENGKYRSAGTYDDEDRAQQAGPADLSGTPIREARSIRGNLASASDLTNTTRYVKILDEEDSNAADAIAAILGDVA